MYISLYISIFSHILTLIHVLRQDTVTNTAFVSSVTGEAKTESLEANL